VDRVGGKRFGLLGVGRDRGFRGRGTEGGREGELVEGETSSGRRSGSLDFGDEEDGLRRGEDARERERERSVPTLASAGRDGGNGVETHLSRVDSLLISTLLLPSLVLPTLLLLKLLLLLGLLPPLLPELSSPDPSLLQQLLLASSLKPSVGSSSESLSLQTGNSSLKFGVKVGDRGGFRDGLTRGVGGRGEVAVDHGDVVGVGIVLGLVLGFGLRLGSLFGLLGGGGRGRSFELGGSVEEFGNGEVVGGIELGERDRGVERAESEHVAGLPKFVSSSTIASTEAGNREEDGEVDGEGKGGKEESSS